MPIREAILLAAAADRQRDGRAGGRSRAGLRLRRHDATLRNDLRLHLRDLPGLAVSVRQQRLRGGERFARDLRNDALACRRRWRARRGERALVRSVRIDEIQAVAARTGAREYDRLSVR